MTALKKSTFSHDDSANKNISSLDEKQKSRLDLSTKLKMSHIYTQMSGKIPLA